MGVPFFSCSSSLFSLFFFRFSKALTSWVSHLCLADFQTVHIAVCMLQDPKICTSFVLLGYLAGSHNSHHGCPNCCFAGFQNLHIIYVLHRYLAVFQNSCIMDVPIFFLQGPKTPTWLTQLMFCRIPKLPHHGCPKLLFCRVPKLLHHGCPNCCFAGSQNSHIMDVPNCCFAGSQNSHIMMSQIVVLQDPKTPTSWMSRLFCRVPKLPHHGCHNCCFAGSQNSCIMDVPIVVLQGPKTPASWVSQFVVLQGPKTPASWVSQLLFCRVPKLLHHGCPNCCFAGSQNSCIMDVPIVLQGPKPPASWMSQLLFCRVPKLPHHGCPKLLFCRVPKLPHHGCSNCCFAGSQNSRIMDAGHNRLPLHGRGAAYSRGDAERLMHKLVIEGVLIEELKITAADTAACYIRLGPKAASLMQNKLKVSCTWARCVCGASTVQTDYTE